MNGSPTRAGTCRSMRVKPDTARLGQVRQFVDEVAAGLPLDPEKVFDLKVAVSEACTNAAKHAGRATPQVEIAAFVDDGRLTVTVTDKGSFHTPTTDRLDGDSRGLGMPLMVALMDEVTFTRKPGGGTVVSLTVLF